MHTKPALSCRGSCPRELCSSAQITTQHWWRGYLCGQLPHLGSAVKRMRSYNLDQRPQENKHQMESPGVKPPTLLCICTFVLPYGLGKWENTLQAAGAPNPPSLPKSPPSKWKQHSVPSSKENGRCIKTLGSRISAPSLHDCFGRTTWLYSIHYPNKQIMKCSLHYWSEKGELVSVAIFHSLTVGVISSLCSSCQNHSKERNT